MSHGKRAESLFRWRRVGKLSSGDPTPSPTHHTPRNKNPAPMPTLHWLTRDEDVRAAEKTPTRLLEEAPELGYGDRDAGNMLIQGDNLEALKALLPYYAGQVKCIYIDPPYNTGAAFEHYDDKLEHSMWLAIMWPRLELLRELLAEDGSIWVSIDDREAHYLKIILDEVFGRNDFLANVVWQKRYSREIRACRQLARNNAYQKCLLGPEAALEVSFDAGFRFFDGVYGDVSKYSGNYKFSRHFMGPDHVPAFDGAPGGEEEQCAMVIDSFPGVKYWTRNVARHSKSFSLPTATDKFYPDFVALMEDGRLLVVEYKGQDRAPDNSSDAREKQLISEAWARVSGGKAVFVMATMARKDPGEIHQTIHGALQKPTD